MNLSKTRRAALYNAINSPVTDARVSIKQLLVSSKREPFDVVDDYLWNLDIKIHSAVKKALDVED